MTGRDARIRRALEHVRRGTADEVDAVGGFTAAGLTGANAGGMLLGRNEVVDQILHREPARPVL